MLETVEEEEVVLLCPALEGDYQLPCEEEERKPRGECGGAPAYLLQGGTTLPRKGE